MGNVQGILSIVHRTLYIKNYPLMTKRTPSVCVPKKNGSDTEGVCFIGQN
jgi:hypothetical protein